MISEYYPDTMTQKEYDEHFGQIEIDYEDSLCKSCAKGKYHKKGCMCGNSLLTKYELPAKDEECDGYEE